MIRIETLSDLRRSWKTILAAVSRDLAFAGRLARDPISALRGAGYEISGEAATALQRALP